MRWLQLRFDFRSTAFHTSQGRSDVTHQWPLTRWPHWPLCIQASVH